MNKLPIPTAFGDLEVSPARQGLRNALGHDALVRRPNPAHDRYLALLSLGLIGDRSLSVDEVIKRAVTSGAPWDPVPLTPALVRQAVDSAEETLAQDPRVRWFRAGLEGKACLAALRLELTDSAASRRAKSAVWQADAQAKVADERAQAMDDTRTEVAKGALILGGVTTVIGFSFGLAIAASGQAGLIVVAPVLALAWLGEGLLAHGKLRQAAALADPAAPPVWLDLVPSWRLVEPVTENTSTATNALTATNGPTTSGQRQLRDQLRAIVAAAYEGETLADAHQALSEISDALFGSYEQPVCELELILPAAFADALVGCPCGTLADLHLPRIEGCAPIGEAYGLMLSRDPDANGLTLRWRTAPGEDPYVVIAPLPAKVLLGP